MLLTLRKPAAPDPTTDHEGPTTVTNGPRSPWSGSWSARPQARPRVRHEHPSSHRGRYTRRAYGPLRDHPPGGHQTPRTDTQTHTARATIGTCAMRHPDLRTRQIARPRPDCAATLRTTTEHAPRPLRSLIAQPPAGAAQSGSRSDCARAEACGRPDHSRPTAALPDRDRWSGLVAAALVGVGG